MKKALGAIVAALLAMTLLVGFGSPARAGGVSCSYDDPQLQYPCRVFTSFDGHVFNGFEASYWAGVGQADGRLAEVAGLLYNPEIMSTLVGEAYEFMLGRNVDPTGARYWTDLLQTASISYEQLAGQLLSSGEGYAHVGGTDTSYIQALYEVFLDRSAGDTEVAYWQSVLPTIGRYNLSQLIAGSAEGVALRLAEAYHESLGRDVDSAGAAYWGPFLRANGELATILFLTASDEGYANFTSPSPVSGSITSIVPKVAG